MAKGKKLKKKEQVQCFHHSTYMLINYSNLIPHSHISCFVNMVYKCFHRFCITSNLAFFIPYDNKNVLHYPAAYQNLQQTSVS